MLTPLSFMPGAAAGGDFLLQLMPIILMIVIFYFLLFRPQQQRVAAHRQMVENIRRGDTVVTQGGLIGKVTRVKDGDAEIEVELNENNRVRVIRGTIAEVRVKGEPTKDA
jgi:preprotein translocase subunit YajC